MTVRVCLVSTFYPNSAMPHRAVFVRHLAAELQTRASVSVVAPVPFAPPIACMPRWRMLRSIPRRAADGQMPVFHPRFIVVPGLELLNGLNYCLGTLGLLRSLVRDRAIEVLHAHCAYPDGVGVALAAAALRLPFVVTAHGSDINVYAEKPGVRPQLRWALRRAAAVIAVSRAIGAKIRALAPELGERIIHIPCAAADPRVFAVRDRAQARGRLMLDQGARVVLYAGQLVPIKQLDTLVRAWALLRQAGRIAPPDRLVLVGAGRMKETLQSIAHSAHLTELVTLVGEVPQGELSDWLCAANVFCLPSRNEGTPNVVVEALASGRPVVASAVGGIPELVRPAVNGFLVSPGSAPALAEGLAAALAHSWDAAQIAVTVSGYTWDVLAQRNAELLSRVAGGWASGLPCV